MRGSPVLGCSTTPYGSPGAIIEIRQGETPDEALLRAQREYVETSPRHPVAADGEQQSRILALPTDSEERKKLPIATGVIDYFPDAFVAIAELSRIGNDKHNPGMPLHWSRGKSDDHPDALMRHFIERGKVDINGVRHSTQVAWRALAILQLELEKAAIDAMEENAWRLKQPAEHPDEVLRRWGPRWRKGDAVRARAWPDVYPEDEIPEDAVGLPCDVEPEEDDEDIYAREAARVGEAVDPETMSRLKRIWAKRRAAGEPRGPVPGWGDLDLKHAEDLVTQGWKVELPCDVEPPAAQPEDRGINLAPIVFGSPFAGLGPER